MSLLITHAFLQDQIVEAITDKPVNKLKGLLDMLVQRGRSLNFQTDAGITPLMLAARGGNLRKVQLILSYKPSLTIKDNLSFTVAHHAACSTNAEVIQLLWSKGVDFSSLTDEGYTAEICARTYRRTDVRSRLKTLSPFTHAYSYEFRKRKLLAHLLELEGGTELVNPNPLSIQKHTFTLEGWFADDFWHILGKRIKLFFEKHPAPDGIDPSVLYELCQQAASNSCKLEQYQQNKPILINTGHKQHHSTVVLWGKCAVLCERNGTFGYEFVVMQIDPKKVDNSFIDQIKSLKISSHNTYIRKLNELFYSIADPVQHPMTKELTDLMHLGRQTVGNCAWANSEGAIYALFVLQSVLHHVKDGVHIVDIVPAQNRLFEELKNFIIHYDAEKYLDHHIHKPAKVLSYPTEANFLRLIQPKLPQELALKVETLLKR